MKHKIFTFIFLSALLIFSSSLRAQCPETFTLDNASATNICEGDNVDFTGTYTMALSYEYQADSWPSENSLDVNGQVTSGSALGTANSLTTGTIVVSAVSSGNIDFIDSCGDGIGCTGGAYFLLLFPDGTTAIYIGDPTLPPAADGTAISDFTDGCGCAATAYGTVSFPYNTTATVTFTSSLDGPLGTAAVSTATAGNVTFSTAGLSVGTHTITMDATGHSFGCDAGPSNSFTVVVDAIPDPAFSCPTNVCQGAGGAFALNPIDNNAAAATNGAATGAWSGSAASAVTADQLDLNALTPGAYDLTYTLTSVNGLCIETVTCNFDVFPEAVAPAPTSVFTCLNGAGSIAAAGAGGTYDWYTEDPSLNPSATPVFTGDPFVGNTAVPGATDYWVTETNGDGCVSPPAMVTLTVYPDISISVNVKSCDGMIADEYVAGATDPTDDIVTLDVMVAFTGAMPAAGTLTLVDNNGNTIGGTLTGNVAAGDFAYTFTNITVPGDGAATFDFQVTFDDGNGNSCVNNATFGPFGDCSCMQYTCQDNTMFESATVTGNETSLTTTYVLVEVGTTAILQESSTAVFDASVLMVDAIYQVHAINYSPASGVTPPAPGGDLDAYINPTDLCHDVAVSFPCYVYVEPLPEVTDILDIVVCDGDVIDQVVTIVSTGTATPGTYNFDWEASILTVGDPDLTATSGSDGNDANGGSVALGDNIMFTADDEEPGGDGTVSVITVTPFYQPTDGDGICGVPWCIGEELTFNVSVASEIVMSNASSQCDNYNQFTINVTGGYPDLAGANADALQEYAFTLEANATPTITPNPEVNGGAYTFTDITGVGTLTLDVVDNLGCSQTTEVNVYDPIVLTSESPSCGIIDVTGITGGWDPNDPAFTDGPTGYVVSITGPNNSAIAPAATYTYSGNPITSPNTASFTPGDASGVPVNGLPGGQYTITVLDGQNAACPAEFTIDVIGCCPASTDANTDYQLCGLNDPTAQPGPTSMLNPTPTPIFGDLPSLTVNNTATNLNIDPDTDLTLNTDDGGSGQDAGGDGVDWFLGPDPLSAQPYSDNAMVSASVCAPGIYTLYAFLRCDGNHDGNFTPSQTGTNPGSEVGFDPTGTDSYIPAGTVTVTVWPEIAIPDVSYPNDPVECQVNLENPCPDVYVLEVTDDDGNNYITDNSGGLFLGPGNIYTYDGLATPLPGTIGDLTLTITNPAAQAAFDAANPGGDDSYSDGDNVTCREFTFERDYVCCLAEAGGLDASFECPPTELADGTIDGAGDPTTITIDDYMGDNGTLQLPNYQTYVIIADAAGNIYGVVLAAETDGTGTLSSNLPVNIPYGDYAGYNGYGVDYYYYSYNVFLSNPPVAACLPVGITVPSPPAVSTVVGAATTIAQVTTCTSPFEGCFDLSSPDVVYIPEPLSLVCDQDVSQGGFGGIGPVYYNIHEICIAGGTPPYDYHWDTEGYVRHSIIKNPPVGEGDEKIRIIYSDRAVWRVTVYDANGCTHDPTWYFTNDMSAPGALLDIAQAVVTPGNTNGSQFNICTTGGIDICVEGGTPPYTYDWYGPNTWTGGPMLGMSATGAGTCSSGSEAYSLTGLPLGWYQVTITDSAPAPDTQITYDWYWVYCVTPGRGKVNSFTDNHLTAMPNPVIHTTNIEYSVTQTGQAVISLYDVSGKQMLDLFRGSVEANKTYSLPFSTGKLSTGIYILRMTDASGRIKNHKLIISK